MNLSKAEQRVLHVLAQGGCIRHARGLGRKIEAVACHTREGAVLSDCTLEVFSRLKRRGLIASRGGAPYRSSRRGIESVRAQADNRQVGR